MITITGIGCLGADPKETGTMVVANVAVKTGYGEREVTTWWGLKAWGKTGSFLLGSFKKGDWVCFSGTPYTREHNGKVYATCDVRELSFPPRARDPHAAPGRAQAKPKPKAEETIWGPAPDPDTAIDDVPF